MVTFPVQDVASVFSLKEFLSRYIDNYTITNLSLKKKIYAHPGLAFNSLLLFNKFN